MEWGNRQQFQRLGNECLVSGAIVLVLGFVLNFAYFNYSVENVYLINLMIGLTGAIVGSGFLILGVAVCVAGNLRQY